jgi:cell division protein FtsB
VKQKKKALSLDSSNTVVKRDIKDDDDDEDGEGDYIIPKARAGMYINFYIKNVFHLIISSHLRQITAIL